ncbi:phosphotransferase enzyme family protein [Actinopolymorpha pittospori]|uniref:Aminoglycoside phosphotransferase (APT) family kinase protein n=1 Tax=Actinopolymorpha pittospori TaxID=648752 RepID=A0A927MS45_9ACTN|nr:phosphotransferase [Actinopolymorpha pittospori]MBE1604223.1 aminoglycoside phosphotransferase (APT) family kinase protein [Actinopolymorpha pittospori]
MTHLPSEAALAWAHRALGADASVHSVESLNVGRGPWLLRVDQSDRTRDVVLRVGGRITTSQIVTGAAALRYAEEHGLPAPRLLATDLDGSVAGAPATLETALPGSSRLPGRVSLAQLHAAGAALARVHRIPLDPRPDLPLRHHSTYPVSGYDRARSRRWAALYRACPDEEKATVVEALCEWTGVPARWVRQWVNEPLPTPLLLWADDCVREHGRPDSPTGFVHGDVWWGNTRWDGDTFLALIDWKDSGAGSPGVDIGGFRFQMAITYGADPDPVLEGWEREAGMRATNVAYWDAVAALDTPTVLDGWPGYDDQGRPLDAAAVTARRDAFLRAAIDRL